MTGEHVALNLLSYSLQIGLLVGACAGIPRLLRVSAPAVHHAFWRAVLAACLLLPLAQPWQPAAPAHTADPASAARATTGAPDSVELVAASDATVPRDWTTMVLVVLAGGAVCRLGWVGLGFIRLRRRKTERETDASSEFEDLQHAIGTRASIRWSGQAEQAVTFGLHHPVILLPAPLKSLDPRALRAVVAHELFHVKRRDWAWLVLEEGVRAVFWFHPAMWWLVSRVQLARETVVDELSILFTNARRTYLDTLLALADASAVSSSTAFSHRRHLFHRVMLLSKEGSMSSIRVVAASTVLALALAASAWTGVRAFPLQTSGTAPAPTAQSQMPPRDPLSPETHHLRATFLLERAMKNTALSPEEKAKALADAIAAEDRALAMNQDYVPSLIYKNLALRMQAEMATDAQAREDLIRQADELREKALALRRAAGIPDPPLANTAPPPPSSHAFQETLARLQPLRIGGTLRTPVKVRNVQAVYPPAAQAAGIQGVVIIEAIINTEGKVEETRVLRSIPQLDAAALDAVRQWEYEPVWLNGVPVPVLMTVTVNFTLER